MKTCRICNKTKEVSDFYKKPYFRDGRDTRCKVCACKEATKNFHNNREYILNREKHYRRHGPNKKTPDSRSYAERNPEKYAAHRIFKYFMFKNNVIRPPCSICGTSVLVQAHHDDYTQPLNVIWLCVKHHKARHRELDKIGHKYGL